MAVRCTLPHILPDAFTYPVYAPCLHSGWGACVGGRESGIVEVRMRPRTRSILHILKDLRGWCDMRRELHGRWLYVREILRRDGAIGAKNYEYLLMHVSMHQALELTNRQRGLIGRRRRNAMERLETDLYEYEKDGRYEKELHDLLREEGSVDGEDARESVLAVLYGWRVQGTAAARYTDYATLAASEDGYTRLVRGEAWAVNRAWVEGARRIKESAPTSAPCGREIPNDLLAGLWNPQRDSFYHHPERVVDAARRLHAGGRGSAMSSERRRSP